MRKRFLERFKVHIRGLSHFHGQTENPLTGYFRCFPKISIISKASILDGYLLSERPNDY